MTFYTPLERLAKSAKEQGMAVAADPETVLRLCEIAKAAEWQPIETAPKDGTNVILSNGESVAQGWWMDEPGYVREHRDEDGRYLGQDESDGYLGWLDFGGGMLPEPTHWMPLPPPSRAALGTQPVKETNDA